ncbi:dihydrofolate reductase family protein [Deminuibacter soli]|uniref:Deaminase n=1 Tax=Deminuibacter soli TaxID=2291815 RepID=A0A3E1NM87_9BACT|nr:RibD family protein [Deminuibacter soli]RFM29021.1 deaminase [Deminuibacter soli]
MKPYVICHMLSSIDGRIQTANWKGMNDQGLYERTGETTEAQAWMCGRTTMQQHFAVPLPDLPEAPADLQKRDHVGNCQSDTCAVVVDQHGKLGWASSTIDGDHIIVVLTEAVSLNYVAYLRSLGISYIFGGKTEINFSNVLEKLNQLFNISRIKLEGGGGINGSMHQAGLIDEYSFVYYPVADGSVSPTSIDTNQKPGISAFTNLTLLHCEVLEGNMVWLRYKVER